MPAMNTLTGRRIAVLAFDGFEKVELTVPVAALCHGPWLLASAGLTSGKTVTSWPGIRDDMVPLVSAMTKLFTGAAAGAQAIG